MCFPEVELAVDLYVGIERTGGATITLQQCPHGMAEFKIASGAQPGGGYMVAILPEPLAHFPMDAWGPFAALATIRGLAANEGAMEFLLTNPFGGLGLWVNPETRLLQLDAVEMYQDQTVALALGASRGQKAIYDLALGRDVLVP